jgi:hypothetical protein
VSWALPSQPRLKRTPAKERDLLLLYSKPAPIQAAHLNLTSAVLECTDSMVNHEKNANINSLTSMGYVSLESLK